MAKGSAPLPSDRSDETAAETWSRVGYSDAEIHELAERPVSEVEFSNEKKDAHGPWLPPESISHEVDYTQINFHSTSIE